MSIKKSIAQRNLKKRQNRAFKIALFLIIVGTGIGLILKVFNDNIVFFFGPTDLIVKQIKPSTNIMRIGGLVKEKSIKKNNHSTEFIITDGKNDLLISYQGILPTLFKEGQGTVATGYLMATHFQAKELLAKHDENYMPKEVEQTLQQSGHWRSND